MERLTHRDGKHINYKQFDVEKVIQKLADYEDAEEQCIKETSFGFKELLHKWKTFTDDVQELLEYRRLEEQGLLLRLPCKVGDTVYLLYKKECYEYVVAGFQFYEGQIQVIERSGCRIGVIGKTVFLTKEEAEQKLESMKVE